MRFPDITGSGQGWGLELDLALTGFDNLKGAFSGTGGNRKRQITTTEWDTPATLQWSFDATKCSSIYGNSQTVQPISVRLMPCIRT